MVTSHMKNFYHYVAEASGFVKEDSYHKILVLVCCQESCRIKWPLPILYLKSIQGNRDDGTSEVIKRPGEASDILMVE